METFEKETCVEATRSTTPYGKQRSEMNWSVDERQAITMDLTRGSRTHTKNRDRRIICGLMFRGQ